MGLMLEVLMRIIPSEVFDVVGIGVPTPPDTWVEPLLKTIRHGAHDALSGKDDDERSSEWRIYTPSVRPSPSPPSTQEEHGDIQDLHLQVLGTMGGHPTKDGQGKLQR
jgi:hypothetical protein